MTLEQLCDCNADELEKLDKEGKLEEFLKPYYTVTRPEIAMTLRKASPSPQAELVLSPAKRKFLAMCAEDGMDLDFLKKMKRK